MAKNVTPTEVTGVKDIKRRSVMQESLDRLVRNKTAMAGLIVLIIIAIICAMASVFCPEGYDAQDLSRAFILPCKDLIT